MSNAKSAIDAVATAAPEAASRVKSAAGSLATPIREIDEHIPKNYSIGTRQVCVGYSYNISCSGLPLNLSTLVSGIISGLPDLLDSNTEDALRDRVSRLQPLADSLTKVSAYFRQGLVLSSVLMAVFVLVFICSVFASLFNIASVVLRLGLCWRVTILLVLGLTYCAPFILLASLFMVLQTKMEGLPPWVEVHSGEVSRLCFGALGCAVVMTLLSAITPIVT